MPAPSYDESRGQSSTSQSFLEKTRSAASGRGEVGGDSERDPKPKLQMFNKGEGGFKDRDLYVWCANASDGIITATPYWNRCKEVKDVKGKHGAPFGETIMENATEETIKETTYWWPRPGTDK